MLGDFKKGMKHYEVRQMGLKIENLDENSKHTCSLFSALDFEKSIFYS